MVTVSGLWVYPIKSCGGIELESAWITPDGLKWDRHWMLVDRNGEFLTQRQFPRMALVETALGHDSLQIRALGMPEVAVPFQQDGRSVKASVWRDKCAAIDVGDLAASWFSDFLQHECRLVAFDDRESRLSDVEFAGDCGATTQFADGFAMLVIGDASLTDLNERLVERGAEPVAMKRFRPNLTLRGINAFDEDHILHLRGEHGLVLRIVKPCARCVITTVDPETGVRDQEGEPLAALNSFRANRDHGTIFGQNAIVIGAKGRLTRGDTLDIDWNF